MRETIPFTTEEAWLAERKKDVTSTEVSALFNVCPYKSKFQLWHEKKGSIEDGFEDNDRAKWGRRLQDAIAFGFAADNNLDIRRLDDYVRLPHCRMGSSFDFITTDGQTLIEVKNVDGLIYKDKWIDGEAPAHIEIQVQHQMHVIGVRKAVIAPLVGGNKLTPIYREYDPLVGKALEDQCVEFWRSIEAGIEPEIQLPCDVDTLGKLYAPVENKVVDVTGDPTIEYALLEYKNLGAEIKALTDRRTLAKGQVLLALGDADKLVCGAYNVSFKEQKGAVVSYERKDSRVFRINERKAK